MAEILTVVDKDRVNYEGVFDAKETVNVMKQWCSDKGYIFGQSSHTETTKPEGRTIELNADLFKKFTDYAKSSIKTKVQFQDIKDVVVERDGKKVKLQEGKVAITMTATLQTDYEARWETKPLFYFVRLLWEKYVYTPFISGFERQIKEDQVLLRDTVKAFLNMQKFL